MSANAKHGEFLKDYQRLQNHYYDTNSKADRIQGEDAKKLIEAKLKEHAEVLKKLSTVSPGHPLSSSIDGGTDYIALQYYDGTISAQVREKNGNTKQLNIWGSKGPEGILMQTYYVDNAVTGSQTVAVLTSSNQVVGECTKNNESLATYQIDLQ